MRTQYLFLALAALLSSQPGHAQSRGPRAQMAVTPDRTNGIYEVGDTVHWQVQWLGNATSAPPTVHFTILKDELTEAGRGEIALVNGSGTLDTRFDEPGHILLALTYGTNTRRTLGGAIASPGEIKPSSARPDDFDAFWTAKIKELKALPANVKLETGDAGGPGVSYAKITMDNVGGSHIYGQIAWPAQGGKFPAIFLPELAGNPHALDRSNVVDRAKQGWLALNIEPHDMPIDASDRSKVPSNWEGYGSDDRDRSHFLRMYLACYRAAKYLSQRPDWNGKVLVAEGDGMGGM